MNFPSSKIACFFLAAVFLFAACDKEDGTKVPDPVPTAVQVKPAQFEQKSEYRTLSGDVTPWDVLPLTFMIGGRITHMYVDEGDEVKKDQLVAIIDSSDYRLVRDLAAVQVDGLAPHVQRAEKLFEKEAVAQATLDQLHSQMSAAKIQRKQAQSQVNYSRLKAPASGIIIRRLAAKGNMTDPQHPVAILANLKRAKVILPAAQRDLPLFRQGMEVLLSEPGSKQNFKGKVFSIGYAADEKTRTFPVTLEVDNSQLLLRAGMVIDAQIQVANHEGIFVPLDAVTRNRSGENTIMVVEKGRAMAKILDLGITLGDQVQIKGGLSKGDKIIIRGMVSDGDLVSLVDAVSLSAKVAQ